MVPIRKCLILSIFRIFIIQKYCISVYFGHTHYTTNKALQKCNTFINPLILLNFQNIFIINRKSVLNCTNRKLDLLLNLGDGTLFYFLPTGKFYTHASLISHIFICCLFFFLYTLWLFPLSLYILLLYYVLHI